jgi:branched-chain amino acid transport system ATP-binding protein
MVILRTESLYKNFGGLSAVNDFNFEIKENEILGLIGPNGAGKTTLFNLITGVYQSSEGEIWFKGEPISKLRPHNIAKMGIARTFQITSFYPSLSVLQNLMVATGCGAKIDFLKTLFYTRSFRQKVSLDIELVTELLEFWDLKDYKDVLSINLSYGHQRRMTVAMAMATKPDLLLLDEPFCGMNPEETADMMSLVNQVQSLGVVVFLIEHDMKAVMNLCDRIVVMNYGKKIAEGSGKEIQANNEVIEAYLGSDYVANS